MNEGRRFAPEGTDAVAAQQNTGCESAPADPVAEVTQQIVAGLRSSPPVITERPAAEGNRTLTVTFPTAKDSIRLLEIFMDTHLKSVNDILARFAEIAEEEELDLNISTPDENGLIRIRLTKKEDIQYRKPMEQANLNFIRCFDFEVA